MFTNEELEKIEKISSELRKLIIFKDDSEAERNISVALVYLDCARHNIMGQRDGLGEIYTTYPSIVVRQSE